MGVVVLSVFTIVQFIIAFCFQIGLKMERVPDVHFPHSFRETHESGTEASPDVTS